jgi:peptidylprolyl isomerase
MIHTPAFILLVLVTVSAGCVHQRQVDPPEARPSDSSGTTEIDPDADVHWRDVDPENILIIHLESGDVLIELAPQFAPAHVEQMRRLAREAHYDQGASFYRVIDNFVAQGGVLREVDSDEEDAFDDGVEPLPAEFERPLGDLVVVRNESQDLYAPETGHIDGFPVGYDLETWTVWPLHCYGAIAMARDTGPNTGSSHFYIVNGRDQRYLDRNLSVFGRVVFGMEHVQKVNRGDRTVDSGVIPDPANRTPIRGMTVATDLPVEERPRLQVMKTDSPAFAQEKERRFYRDSEFFTRKPRAVEACAVTGPVRMTSAEN